MSRQQSVEFGGNSSAARVAFGDDCQFGDCLCYAFLVLRRSRLTRLSRLLARMKKEMRFPDSTSLHCRVLLSGDQRRKAGLEHLSSVAARSVIARVITMVNEVEGHVRYAYASLREFSATLGEAIPVWDSQAGDYLPQPVNADPKGIMAALMNLCIVTPPKDPRIPSPYEWQVIASRDATQVRVPFGIGFRQAHRAVDMDSELEAPAGHAFRLRPIIADAHDQPLLQVADVISYVCAHALDKDNADPFWKEQLSRISNWQQIRFVPISPTGQSDQRQFPEPSPGP